MQGRVRRNFICWSLLVVGVAVGFTALWPLALVATATVLAMVLFPRQGAPRRRRAARPSRPAFATAPASATSVPAPAVHRLPSSVRVLPGPPAIDWRDRVR